MYRGSALYYSSLERVAAQVVFVVFAAAAAAARLSFVRISVKMMSNNNSGAFVQVTSREEPLD